MRHSESLTLRVECLQCHRPVTLQMSDWPTKLTSGGVAVRTQEPGAWECPWCGQPNRGGFPGRLAWATQAHNHSPAT